MDSFDDEVGELACIDPSNIMIGNVMPSSINSNSQNNVLMSSNSDLEKGPTVTDREGQPHEASVTGQSSFERDPLG